MIELRFRIRNGVFNPPQLVRRSTIRPLALLCPSLEEAALLGEVDETGRLTPRRGVFNMSSPRTGPVIEGFEDCALGEFVKAQLEALAENGEPPVRCEVHGLDPFLELGEREEAERWILRVEALLDWVVEHPKLVEVRHEAGRLLTDLRGASGIELTPNRRV